MNREELNEEFNKNANTAPRQPKPLRKLKRIDSSRPAQPVYHALHEAPSIDISIEEEKPKRRAPELKQTYHGLHEKGRAGDVVESDVRALIQVEHAGITRLHNNLGIGATLNSEVIYLI